MPRQKRTQWPGATFHAMSRGNERRPTFFERLDYVSFIQLLAVMCVEFKIEVLSFALMPNHYHLLLRTLNGNVSMAMHWFLTTYTYRFNRRHERVGHLFQGRFKSFLVEDDDYLCNASRYIHLNPVKAKLARYARDYEWSSMRVFMKLGVAEFVRPEAVLSLFESATAYERFVDDGLRPDSTGFTPFDDFRWTKLGRSADEPFVDPSELRGRIATMDLRLQIYALCKWGRVPAKEVAREFRLSEGRISQIRSDLEKDARREEPVRKALMMLREAALNGGQAPL